MKKLFYALALTVIGSAFYQCKPDNEALEKAKKEGYDSAFSLLSDSLGLIETKSLTYKEKQQKAFHNPPDDGHVHDGGYGITAMSAAAGQDYATGIMAVVSDPNHNTADALIPFIVKKGLVKPGDDYLRDKNNHAHLIEYELLDLETIDPSSGKPSGKKILVAFVKKVRPKQ